MSNFHVQVAILGGGIAGLGAAHKARALGNRSAVIFEARPAAGGLLDNFTVAGFRFDHAVHLSFATEAVVRDVFDQTPYLTHPSDSYCFEAGRWLKHPVQNNLFPLPADEKVALLKSFLDRPAPLEHDDYESWLRHQYGDGIAERYPLRYTRKYWDTPASDLSTRWIGNRMRRATLDEVLFGALSGATPNHYYTKEMRYPKEGGFKAFIQPLIDATDIRCGHAVVSIDPKTRRVRFSNGNAATYETLVSTLPLPELTARCDAVPERVRAAADSLKATSLDLVSIGFNKPLVKDLWFYIYDEGIHASRAYSPSVKSPDNAPPGCSSLQFEVYSRGTESRFTASDVIANTRQALETMKLAGEDDIVCVDHRRIRYGNVIFDQHMETARDLVLDWCTQVGIRSCGRFGRWDYLWSHQSFLSGYEALENT